jgi:hypothetical protein
VSVFEVEKHLFNQRLDWALLEGGEPDYQISWLSPIDHGLNVLQGLLDVDLHSVLSSKAEFGLHQYEEILVDEHIPHVHLLLYFDIAQDQLVILR